MPSLHGAHLNDNIRTEHLKCMSCRTQIQLAKIEQDRDGWETRTFTCPHCTQGRTIRLAMPAYARRHEAGLACRRADERLKAV